MDVKDPLFLSPLSTRNRPLPISCGANHACLLSILHARNMQVSTSLMQVPRLSKDKTIVEASINAGHCTYRRAGEHVASLPHRGFYASHGFIGWTGTGPRPEPCRYALNQAATNLNHSLYSVDFLLGNFLSGPPAD